ncbi:SGNH/GDSL hydrolase family protein [Ilumatobacter sp.]|uniref:SGNH/GDSL hydrolase family protein n=1 Tax=Ilumatobacter sp. TaxID=1967498 RepID=UPI003298D98E
MSKLTATTLLCVGLVVGGSHEGVEAATEITVDRAGPLGPVTVIGDSVLLGAGLYGPTLPDQLSARGWGPIRFRAAGSATSGKFPVADEYRSSFWIDRWQSQGWDPRHVIVNLGVNDSGFCGTDLACAVDSIMHVVESIGPGHEIWWPTITKSSTSARDTFNRALRVVDAERDDVHVWDWLAEFDAGGYRSGDQVHLDPDGYRRRSDRMATEFTERFSVARRTGGDVALPTPTTDASTFVVRTPQRLVDTRVATTGPVRAGSRLRIDLDDVADDVPDGVPDDATAVALHVTSARATGDGHLSTGPCDAPPSGATLNFRSGRPIGAPTVTPIGDDRTVCVFASEDTDVVVDLQGVFVAGSAGERMSPLETPSRLHDTRRTGRLQRVVVDAAAALAGPVDAVAVNLTSVGPDGIGFLTASRCDDPPGTAALNFAPGAPVSSSAFVPVGADGTFCVDASIGTDIVVDLTAGFGRDGDLAYVPIVATRTLDTRDGTGGWAPVHGADQTLDVGVAPSTAAAVTGTLTLVRPVSTGFATAFGCVGAPPTSSANAGAGVIGANSVTTSVTNGRMCLTSSARAQTVFDTNGWWIDA